MKGHTLFMALLVTYLAGVATPFIYFIVKAMIDRACENKKNKKDGL